MSECPNCGSTLDPGAKFCASCGFEISPKSINEDRDQEFSSSDNAVEAEVVAPPEIFIKDRMVAGILAILVGAFGIHKFYLNDMGMGILYLLFSWTGIPTILGLIEGVIYLTTSDEEFQEKYVKYN